MQNSSAGAYPSPLHLISCHDNDPGILLPNHLPEIKHCSWYTALSGNVPQLRSRHLTTDVVRIDVVRTNDTGVRVFEDNTRVVICEQRSGAVKIQYSS